MSVKQVPWKERISYSLTDTASNLVFQVVTTYLLFYYTDSVGLKLEPYNLVPHCLQLK